jgi:hypothetical protein
MSFESKSPCKHGLTDDTEITDKSVIDDYRHRTHTEIYGYWCKGHGSFGSHMVKKKDVVFPARETTAPKAANA